MWSAAIVEVEPAGECGVAFGAVAVDRCVGPAAEHGADEPFGLTVGLRPVGAGPEVTDPQRAAGDRVLFLGAGDDFDPIIVEMPDDLRPQVIYPAVISHWIAQEIIEMEHAMSDGTMETVAEFALSA